MRFAFTFGRFVSERLIPGQLEKLMGASTFGAPLLCVLWNAHYSICVLMGFIKKEEDDSSEDEF